MGHGMNTHTHAGIAGGMPAAQLTPAQFAALTPVERVTLVRSSDGVSGAWKEWLLAILMLGRPRTCVPGMLTYLLGLGYVGATFSAYTVTQAILCFLGGFVANLENAYTDIEEDCRNLPGRVYVLTRLGPGRLLRAIVGLHVAMLAAAAALDVHNLVFMAVALVIVHQYSFGPLRAKRRPLTGLLVFACVVSYPFFVALLADPEHAFAGRIAAWWRGDATHAHEVLRYLAMGAFVTAWFIAKGMFKNVPDYYGDRAAGVRTSATVFPSWFAAAAATACVTLATYASFGLLVVFGLEPPRLLLALVFALPVAAWNCLRLLKANDGAAGNLCLKTDMIISVAFISLVLLLAHPGVGNGVAVAAGAAVLALSDLLQVDSRRRSDVGAGAGQG
jgi:4-hydroxybenzoate polyprenyltransferase